MGRALADLGAEESAAEADALRRKLVRLACDVHDGPMQSLTAVGYSVYELRRRLGALEELDIDAVSLHLDLVLSRLADTESGLRALIGRLEHADPAIDSLDEILDAEIVAFAQRCTARIEIEAPTEVDLDSSSQAIALRSVLREALTNVAKHANATKVRIRVGVGAQGILLEVEDDGDGFDQARVRPDALGLAGMTQRVDLLGGYFGVLSRPGGPTVVTARFERWRRPA